MTTYERIASARSPFDRYLAGEPLPQLAPDPEVCVFCGHEWKHHGIVKTFGGAPGCAVFTRWGRNYNMCHCTRKRDGS